MLLVAVTTGLIATPFAAVDLLGFAALLTAAVGAVSVFDGIIRNRRRGSPADPDQHEQVSELIRHVQDLERCKAERNALSHELDFIRSEVLRANVEKRRLRTLLRENKIDDSPAD